MTEGLASRDRLALGYQRLLGHLVGGLLVWPLALFWMRWVRGYRIADLARARERAAELVDQAAGPVLVCPNHLTWIDSLVLQWALVSPVRILREPRWLAWNVPERRNFYARHWLRLACYLTKCIPVVRGGDREQQKSVIDKVCHALEGGDLVIVFPEGGRTRSGRVDTSEIAYGVGRLARSVEGCSVLCVYLRGDRQHEATVLPRRGETFSVDMSLVRPPTVGRGLRATRETARAIGAELARLEERYFADRQ